MVKKTVAAVSQQLENNLGRGYSLRSVRRTMQFAEQFQNLEIVTPVVTQLSWSQLKPAYKGQMKLYLKWLNKHERQPAEESPIGLILCAGKSSEQIELLEMHKEGIMVAEYWTELPPKEELEKKLQSLLKEARERIGNQLKIDD